MLWRAAAARGEHTLTFRVTGEMNPKSRYIWTTVDRFEVTL